MLSVLYVHAASRAAFPAPPRRPVRLGWGKVVTMGRSGRVAGPLPLGFAVPRDEQTAGSATGQQGLVALYARRVDSSGVDLVPIVEQRRDGSATPYGLPRRGFQLGAQLAPPRPVGRGTREHRLARRGGPAAARPQPRSAPRHDRSRLVRYLGPRAGTRRKLVAAGLAALILVVGAAGSGLAHARDAAPPGETIASVAGQIGMDPPPILAAGWAPRPPKLTNDGVLIAADPGRSPGAAAARPGAAREGAHSWVVDASSLSFRAGGEASP